MIYQIKMFIGCTPSKFVSILSRFCNFNQRYYNYNLFVKPKIS